MTYGSSNGESVSRPHGSSSSGSSGYRASPGKPSGKPGPKKERPPQEVIHTWAFDSVGTRKYALQIKKASNGNPCLKIVEGVPAEDGSYRKFSLTIWSEDFSKLFETLDAVREYMKQHDIKTPAGHKYDPSKSKFFARKPSGDSPRKPYAKRS